MIRIAAVGDLHFGEESSGRFRAKAEDIAARADALLVAGDLTRCGSRAEAEVAAGELRDLGVPTVAVLGNHDHHSGDHKAVAETLVEAGIHVLEGTSIVLDLGGARLGVAGVKGFCGGFWGATGSEFGEAEMKAFMSHTRESAGALEAALREIRAEATVALLHYAPIPDTLQGERLEIYPFLGSYLFAEAIDRAGADLAIHGHAHAGVEKGMTPGGVQVRNVAAPVIGHAFNLYEIAPRAA